MFGNVRPHAPFRLDLPQAKGPHTVVRGPHELRIRERLLNGLEVVVVDPAVVFVFVGHTPPHAFTLA